MNNKKIGRPKQKPSQLIRALKEDVKTMKRIVPGKTNPCRIKVLINTYKKAVKK